jgi:DNA repair exonuclease SbcCD ATPase subunit
MSEININSENKYDQEHDQEHDVEKKRKRAPLSSASSALENSITSPEEKKKQKQKTKKKKKGDKLENKESKTDKKQDIEREPKMQSEKQQSHQLQSNQDDMAKIFRQLTDLNARMSTMISKEDGSLRSIIKEVFSQMKDEFLNSVSHRIDVLEGKLFEKESENDRLQREVKKLERELENQKDENEKLKSEMIKSDDNVNEKMNRLEQYSRINNIRIDGIPEDKEESRFHTENKVLKYLNQSMPTLKLRINDIEIAHRLGKSKNGKPRQIIVQFCSRNTKTDILSRKKQLKGTGIFVNEDLTQLNMMVLACVRKKQPDEVESVWTINGNIFYKNKSGTTHKVMYKEYQDWIELPWPEVTESTETVTPNQGRTWNKPTVGDTVSK